MKKIENIKVMKSCMKRMSVLKLWRSVATVPFCVAGRYGNKCAMPPIHLSGLFCTVCKGTLQIVGSALQAVQRHLANCQKHIASCAKAPCKLSEAHCTLCKGALQIVKSPLQIAKVVLIMQWIKKLKVVTAVSVTQYYDEIQFIERPGAGIGDIRRSQ